MKKIILSVLFVVSSITSFAQNIYKDLTYGDIGLMLSENSNFGTARFEGINGAFGALGGDLSAGMINPAGIAVSNRGMASVTLAMRTYEADTNFEEKTSSFNDNFFNFSQAGIALKLGAADENSKWQRYMLSFNYNKKAHFGGGYHLRNDGVSNKTPYYIKDFQEIANDYKKFDRNIYQEVNTQTDGSSGVFNIGFSAYYNNKLYIGGSLNFHSFDYTQHTIFHQETDNSIGQVLILESTLENSLEGNGFSLGLGAIYKVNKSIRLGLAYETPTWYGEIIDESAYVDNNAIREFETDELLEQKAYEEQFTDTYQFNAPSRLTASGAYIFGKDGLISIDYTFRNYKGMKLRNSETSTDFNQSNQNFNNNYRGTHAINIGTEWRFDEVSVRGGYHFEQNPNTLVGRNTNEDNFKGFSLGAGYNFGKTKLDLSYQNNSNTDFRKTYTLDDTSINKTSSRITATLTFGL